MSSTPPTTSSATPRPLAPADIDIAGDLRRRLMRNFDRLEQPDYAPDKVYEPTRNSAQWPGDTPGQTILALSHLSRITRRPARHLDELVRVLPQHLNALGYMGEDHGDVLDEQQLSGHGWLVSGLLAYRELTGDAPARDMALRIVDQLFMQASGRLGTYPVTPEARRPDGSYSGTRAGRVGRWELSTDIGCAFIMLEGLVDAHEITRRHDHRALIEEALDVFETIDLVAGSVQLHATLTATRQFLRYHDLSGGERIVALARRVYGLFRDRAMTENYANYNWFNRPTWTEPCAIVDAFLVALDLWRKTGDEGYLADAHHIYYNALGHAQKPHGGFGCDNCVGAGGDEGGEALFNKVYDVSWCCNMRGAVGLSAAARWAYVRSADAVNVLFLHDSVARLDFADGTMTLALTTKYPIEGTAWIEVTGSTIRSPKTMRIYVPEWVDHPERAVRATTASPLDGPTTVVGRFYELTHPFAAGDAIELRFDITPRREPAVHAPRLTYRHGPLILGTDSTGDEPGEMDLTPTGPATYRTPARATYRPINDVIDQEEDGAKTEARRILFPARRA